MLSSSKPKMPTLYRIRTDMTWEDVVHNWTERIITPTGMYLDYSACLSVYFSLYSIAAIES